MPSSAAHLTAGGTQPNLVRGGLSEWLQFLEGGFWLNKSLCDIKQGSQNGAIFVKLPHKSRKIALTQAFFNIFKKTQHLWGPKLKELVVMVVK